MNNNVKRKCIVTGDIKPIEKMVRIVKTNSGSFIIDSKAQGRGAYISRDKKLIPLIIRKKPLNRSFKMQVDKNVYKELVEILEGGEDAR